MMSYSQLVKEIKSISVFELVLTLVLAVGLGVAFWGWTFVYEIFKPLLKLLGLSYLVAGFWIFASLIVPYIIQKPGIALLASLMAAFVQSLLTHWGPMSLMWGFVQGMGAEIVFFIFAYKKWNLAILVWASIIATVFSYVLDYYYYGYDALNITFNLLQISSYLFSSIILGALLSFLIAKRLVKLGILDQFKIGQLKKSKKHTR